jgi:PAS domain S-box-containing protein
LIVFEAFAERMPLGIYRTTLNGRILFVNQALVEMLGYPNKETLMKINVRNGYVEPEERQYFLNQVQAETVVRSMEAT